MTVNFHKYQGTGNDFIMIDNRGYGLNKNQTELIKRLCNRRFGIGADGLILLNEKPGYDFEMMYFNSDGNESTMCGNGGRCIIQFARHLELIQNTCRFVAIDGEHAGSFTEGGNVSLKMNDVKEIENYNNDFVLNTGSPHYVTFVNNTSSVSVIGEARKIRYSAAFEKEGINVNFVERISDGEIYVRTYERGVEDETLSCGTGVVAASLSFALKSQRPLHSVIVQTLGGSLEVRFESAGRGFENIFLIGAAEKVFQGNIEVSV